MADLHALAELPDSVRHVVSEADTDFNGHMNVAPYFTLQLASVRATLARLGFAEDYRHEHDESLFTVEHRVHYLAESGLGDALVGRSVITGRSERTVHVSSFLVNESRGVIANRLDAVLVHVDLRTRRGAPVGSQLAEAVAQELADRAELLQRLGLRSRPARENSQ